MNVTTKPIPGSPYVSQESQQGFTASADEILIENEAIKVEKIVDETTLGFYPWKLLYRIFDRMRDKENGGVCWPLAGVYMLGYMSGVRAERKRRKKGRTLEPIQTKEAILTPRL